MLWSGYQECLESRQCMLQNNHLSLIISSWNIESNMCGKTNSLRWLRSPESPSEQYNWLRNTGDLWKPIFIYFGVDLLWDVTGPNSRWPNENLIIASFQSLLMSELAARDLCLRQCLALLVCDWPTACRPQKSFHSLICAFFFHSSHTGCVCQQWRFSLDHIGLQSSTINRLGNQTYFKILHAILYFRSSFWNGLVSESIFLHELCCRSSFKTMFLDAFI